MRSLRLARIAARAELLRLRHFLRRHAIRAMLGAAAFLFLLAALAGLHVAAVLALADRVTLIGAVLIVAGVDGLLAIVLAVFAARDAPGAVELEALQVRRAAVDEAVETAVLTALLGRLLRVRSLRGLVDIVAALLAGWAAGTRR